MYTCTCTLGIIGTTVVCAWSLNYHLMIWYIPFSDEDTMYVYVIRVHVHYNVRVLLLLHVQRTLYIMYM